MFIKWWKFATKKPLVTSLIFILNFLKIWKRFMTQCQKVAYKTKSMMGVLVIKTTYDYVVELNTSLSPHVVYLSYSYMTLI
jgi:hypothetical protein